MVTASPLPLCHFVTSFTPWTGTLLSLRDISPIRGITYQGSPIDPYGLTRHGFAVPPPLQRGQVSLEDDQSSPDDGIWSCGGLSVAVGVDCYRFANIVNRYEISERISFPYGKPVRVLCGHNSTCPTRAASIAPEKGRFAYFGALWSQSKCHAAWACRSWLIVQGAHKEKSERATVGRPSGALKLQSNFLGCCLL